MIGPLPHRYRIVVVLAALLVGLGAGLWLAAVLHVPVAGFATGVVFGVLAAFVLVHDFTQRRSVRLQGAHVRR